MIKWILKIVGQGLMALIPIGLTVATVVWLGVWTEKMLANPFKGLFPGSGEAYRMGMGILSFLLLAFICGLLMQVWLVRRLVEWVEEKFMAVPLVKTVFGAIKDVTNFFGGGDKKKKDGAVVMVTLENGWRQIGIVTRRDLGDLPAELSHGDPELLAVYMPFSYQLGGFTYFIRRSECEPVPDMTAEDAMRYSLMAWLGGTDAVAERTEGKGDAQQPG